MAENGERADFPEPALKDLRSVPPLQAVQAWLCVLARQIPGTSLESNAKECKGVQKSVKLYRLRSWNSEEFFT